MPTSKVRIYDLAKELKLESKRVIEEARREGVDVSVPSNSVSKDLAERLRNKYLPKKETVAPRQIRIIKGSKKAHEDEIAPTLAPAMEEAATEVAPSIPATGDEATPMEQMPTAPRPTGGVRLVKPMRMTPATRVEHPPASDEQTGVAAAPALAEQTAEMQLAREVPAAEAPELIIEQPRAAQPSSDVAPSQTSAPAQANGNNARRPAIGASPSGTSQVRQLKLTPDALTAGLRPGERAPVPVAPPRPVPSPRERDARHGRPDRFAEQRDQRARGGRTPEPGLHGTVGETSTPQTTYTPPADARRGRPGRGAPPRRGGGGARDSRGRHFDRDAIQTPRTLTLEDRIRGSISFDSATADSGDLKPARLVEGSTVKEFAEKLGIKPKDIVALLLQRGVFATINQALNDDVAVDLGKRFGFEVSFVPFEEMVAEEEFEDLIATDADDVELPRAPVITVMGHVDHGKTSLLDSIRTTDVASGEAGGITQHIGAYSVNVSNADTPDEKRRVVFLDTPGHEAFTLMRARGAKATDIVVLVVAADDGVMPQTIEAIEHSRAAGVPIVVAINKIDRPDANPDRVKQELTAQGLQPVEWGGDTEMVEVSAKQRTNLDTMLETILLTADILDLKASPTRLASGVVLEAKLDRGRGSVPTVLVQQGTLRVGDPVIAGQVFGKVRAMFDDRGQSVAEAAPATPVEVLGLQGVPQAGDSFQVVADITRAQSISQHRQQLTRQNALLASTKRGIEALGEREVKELLVVLKADVQGSVEVLKSTLQKLSTDAVKVKVVRSGVGAITESDVLLASATQAGQANSAVVIIGFNVRPEPRAAELAKQEAVDVRAHSIIYKVEEEIRAAMVGMLDAIESERVLGKAEVAQVFRVPKLGAVAGSRVTEGIMRRNAQARLIRDGVVAWEGAIASLRRLKDDVAEVRDGFECGIGLVGFNDIKVGDQIEAYIIERVAATEL